MKAFTNDIYKYLNAPCQYKIPIYQRTYSWEYEQCSRLWNDIVKIHSTNKESHFIGSIVRIDEDSPAGFSIATVIDGQQRLTTLTLLLIALRDYAKDHKDYGINPDEITDTCLLNKYKENDAKYKLILTEPDRNLLTNKIDGTKVNDAQKSRILSNYNYFAKQINIGKISPANLYNAIGKLQIVDIVLDRRYDDPQMIFESLNSTGMDLKDSDLIRNHLLMGLDHSRQIDIYNKIWRPIEMLFDYEHKSELMDNFFRDYLTMKLDKIPHKNEIYKEFCIYHNNIKLSVEELCSDIYHFAKYYSNMYFASSNDSVLKSLYNDMKAIRMDVAYPFLLKAHDDFDNKLIDIEELRQILQLCVSYVLRRAICDMPTNSLNKTFAVIKNSIRNEDYLNSIKAFFTLLDSRKEFPNDKRFLDSFLTRDIYNMDRCKYIMRQLENHNNKSTVITDKLTVEHIMPQNSNLGSEWKKSLGENWVEIQKRYIHTIGNLTLTAYNAEMSDLPFEKKLNMDGGLRQSALRLNKYVVEQTTWSEAQIKERAKQLGEIAKKVWPYPTLSNKELAPYIIQEDTVR